MVLEPRSLPADASAIRPDGVLRSTAVSCTMTPMTTMHPRRASRSADRVSDDRPRLLSKGDRLLEQRGIEHLKKGAGGLDNDGGDGDQDDDADNTAAAATHDDYDDVGDGGGGEDLRDLDSDSPPPPSKSTLCRGE